jgi:hypothetical protein
VLNTHLERRNALVGNRSSLPEVGASKYADLEIASAIAEAVQDVNLTFSSSDSFARTLSAREYVIL